MPEQAIVHTFHPFPNYMLVDAEISDADSMIRCNGLGSSCLTSTRTEIIYASAPGCLYRWGCPSVVVVCMDPPEDALEYVFEHSVHPSLYLVWVNIPRWPE